MSAISVRPFRRDDRDQLTDLVSGHLQAVLPGATTGVNSVLSSIEREPEEFVVDPWVRERVTLVAEQRGRISAAAHLLRYGTGIEVGGDYPGAGEIRWLLHWPDAPFWPDAGAAGRAAGEAALGVLRSWEVTRVLADGTAPGPGPAGVPEQWPHVLGLLGDLGFVSGRREDVLLAEVAALPRAGRQDIDLVRTLGVCGTRFTASTRGHELGFVEVDTSVAGQGRIAVPTGWADIGDLHVDDGARGRGVGTALVAAAAGWLRLARIDRVLAYAEPDETGLSGFLRHRGFDVLTTCHRGWVLTRR